ncbi:hypothetical protein SAMN04488535_1541 [Corynebacterium mycetoides]|uniref:Uncharacterized protein n=1 Tax=Corynebacterium mycetoides TaxID=38302 RepID=A0A1G9PR95_9CORY|nr:hypothetical protein [Corynebacterium mycetoides]SDM00615.1 hypothetical protein SAMN04488535_1541 [Corynebacterium mycetoides]
MTGPTIIGIGSIIIGFALIAAAFLAVARWRRTGLAVGLGIAAFFFVTVIPVILAVFVAAPNPGIS